MKTLKHLLIVYIVSRWFFFVCFFKLKKNAEAVHHHLIIQQFVEPPLSGITLINDFL